HREQPGVLIRQTWMSTRTPASASQHAGPRYDNRTMTSNRLPPARQRTPITAAAIVLALSLVAACADDDPGPSWGDTNLQPDVTTTPTKAIKQQARQFRWEQANSYSGAQAAVAETAKYNSYFQSLRSREHGYVPEGLKPFVEPKIWQDFAEPLDIGASMRGAHAVRLLDIKIDGDRAYTISCIDQRQLQKRPAGAKNWEPVEHDF